MAIVKKNTYVPGTNQDITNVCLNVDYNRLGTDLTRVEWSGSAFLVKVGSLVECNGSLYSVEGSDISLTAADGALYFDSSTVAFSISSGAAAYDAAKAGHYSTATKRLLKWSMLTDGTLLTAGREFQYTGAKSFAFVPPAGIEQIKLAICAQGGNGGASSGGVAGGGGGGGAYFYGLRTVTPGTSYPIVLSTSTNSTAFGMTMGKGSNGVTGNPGTGGSGGTGSGGASTGAAGGSINVSPSLSDPGNGSIMASGGVGTTGGGGGGGGGAGGGGGSSGSAGSGFNAPGVGGAGLFGAGSRGSSGGGSGGAGGFGAGGGAGSTSGGAGGAPLVNIRL